MSVSNFYRYTFFRLLAPFVVGIWCGDYAYAGGVRIPSGLLFAVLVVFLFAFAVLYRMFGRYASRWVFGMFVYAFFLLFGACWQQVRLQESIVAFPSSEAVYRVVVSDRTEEKKKSVLCRVRVLERRDSLGAKGMDSPAVLLYFSPDSAAKAICRGDELLVSARPEMPVLRGNPDAFDYPRYLVRKGISGTGFVAAGKWRRVATGSPASIRDYALDCREKVLDVYRSLGFAGDNFAMLSALTVGYQDELSESVRESFSVSGASHVLALSGLHIGFLYALLLFLVKWIPGTSAGVRICRVMIVVALLWGFAFIAGLSPSVVRSVIMFSLLGCSLFFSGRAVSLNTLFVAAFGMLLYRPSWLYDVGFQLSFVAVASILFIQPWLYGRLSVRNRFLDKLWGLTAVSIAAQIGTAPLVLIYFSRFPVHFLLTNILVVPLVTFIIYVAIAMLLFSFLPPLGEWLGRGLDLLLDLLYGIVRGVERLPFASIDHVRVYPVEVILFYVGLFLLGWYVVRRRPRYLLACLSVVLALSVYRVYQLILNIMI